MAHEHDAELTRPVSQATDPREIARRHIEQLEAEQRPDFIGPYMILETLGGGGMGTVYLAEQTKPLHRRVAIKIIKRGMDTKQTLARFETEREALALMNHPNVAKVYDAGATETGRPYFVMEYVAGIAITDYCDQNRMTTDERLRLFIEVCAAVQHAHQKGIIHRDIKPSNVLVAVQDDRGVPKVIDFGVAKATQHRLTAETVFTELGQMIGTPGYMSPEQASMTALDIDTRSDIYSLGVLLYELLVGALPFDTKQLLDAGYGEIQRIIREVDPPRPSTKLSSLGADSTVVAHKRHTEPRTLARELRGDLDWIVMKCLEKDRTRRYPTANGLALEIQRHLDHQPVLAGPPSAMYRLRKFVRRNRVAVLVTSFMALVLCTGIAAVSWQEVRARRATLAAARADAYRIVLDALTATADLDDPRRSTDERTALTAKVIADCTKAIDLEPNLALAYALRAKMFSREGDIQAAWPDCTRSLELEPTNSLALRTLGYLRLGRGDFHGAFDAYERGIRALVTMDLRDDFHNRARLRQMFGDYRLALGDRDRAVALAPMEGNVYAGRGITRRFLADIDGAISDLTRAAELDRTWGVQCNLWIWEMRMLRGEPGDREAATAALVQAQSANKDEPFDQLYVQICGDAVTAEQALTTCKTEKQRFFTYYYLGAKALVDGRMAEAEDWFKKCVARGRHQSQEFDLARWHLERLANKT